MASISYDEIYSRFYSRVEAYDFLSLSDIQIADYLSEWLRGAIAKPFIRRNYKSLSLDGDIQTLNYEVIYSIDAESDEYFTIEILSLGIAIEWLEPKVASIMNAAQMFTTKESTFYSQANHLSELRETLNYFKKQQRQLITDRGFSYNSYLGGE